MALVFVVQNGAVKPVFVTSGMVIKDDTPAWQMNRGDLHQLTKSDLESILAIGGYGGRFVAHRDKKIEYVDFVERLWGQNPRHRCGPQPSLPRQQKPKAKLLKPRARKPRARRTEGF